jgi:hypothetical protein
MISETHVPITAAVVCSHQQLAGHKTQQGQLQEQLIQKNELAAIYHAANSFLKISIENF